LNDVNVIDVKPGFVPGFFFWGKGFWGGNILLPHERQLIWVAMH
jgi:hypothetical protein